MPIVRVALLTVRGRLIQALNAGQASTWTTDLTTVPAAQADDRRSNTELDNAILAADAQVCRARASTLGDGYRSLFLSLSASIPHGGVIPDHLGPLEQVTIKYATADSVYRAGKFDKDVTLADIEHWREHGAALYGGAHDAGGPISGYYVELGDQLFYTGADAKVQLANVTRTGACQAPEVDEDIVFGIALGNLTKEGDRGPFTIAVQDARQQLAAITGSGIPVQPLDVAQAA